MSLFTAVTHFFPTMSMEQIAWEVPESFLFQCENLYAVEMGMQIVSHTGGVSDSIAEQLKKALGK